MLSPHPGGTSTAMNAAGVIKVQTTFDDGVEMVEEYDAASDALLVRKWKVRTKLGGDRDWEYEVGEPPAAARAVGGAGALLAESGATPTLSVRDAGRCWEWRIRNLPYPKETYLLSIDEAAQQIVLRTTNKKYFKRIDVPCLRREAIPLDGACVSFDYGHNTVVIQYLKPMPVLAMEAAKREERRKKAATAKEGDVDCKTQ